MRHDWVFALVREVQVLAGDLAASKPRDRVALARARLNSIPAAEGPLEVFFLRNVTQIPLLRAHGISVSEMCTLDAMSPTVDVSADRVAIDVCDLLRGDLARRWTLPMLERRLHIGAAILSKAFRRSTGLSINRYHASLRVRVALSLVREKGYRVEAAGISVGYRSKKGVYRDV